MKNKKTVYFVVALLLFSVKLYGAAAAEPVVEERIDKVPSLQELAIKETAKICNFNSEKIEALHIPQLMKDQVADYAGSIQRFLDQGYSLDYSGGTFNCVNKGVTNLKGFRNIPGIANVRSIWLSTNKIKNLEPDIFKGFPYLRYIHLSGNNITRLRAGVFKDLPSLESVDLSNNEIAIIEQGAFSDDLLQLTELLLNRNPLLINGQLKLDAYTREHINRLLEAIIQQQQAG